MQVAWALLRFHVRSAVRASRRLLTPLLGAVAVAAGLSADPAQMLAAIAGIDRPWPALILWFALAWSLAAWTAQRLAPAAHGFLLHLPAASSSHRRAHWWALIAAQLPAYLPLGVLWAAATISGRSIPAWAWFSMPLAAIAIATLTLRTVRHRPVPAPLRLSRWPLTWSINRRAAGWPSPPSALVALLPLLGAALFARHEPSGAPIAALAARLGGVLAIAIAVAGSAEALAQHRPWWSWSRSLPETPGHRVWTDALWIGLTATPAALTTLVVFPRQAWCIWLVWPALAMIAAGALRRFGLAAAGTETLWAGAFAAAAIALWPGLAVLAMPGLWAAQRLAVARDRGLRVSVWDERTSPSEEGT